MLRIAMIDHSSKEGAESEIPNLTKYLFSIRSMKIDNVGSCEGEY
jgi:hypothetical protein